MTKEGEDGVHQADSTAQNGAGAGRLLEAKGNWRAGFASLTRPCQGCVNSSNNCTLQRWSANASLRVSLKALIQQPAPGRDCYAGHRQLLAIHEVTAGGHYI